MTDALQVAKVSARVAPSVTGRCFVTTSSESIKSFIDPDTSDDIDTGVSPSPPSAVSPVVVV